MAPASWNRFPLRAYSASARDSARELQTLIQSQPRPKAKGSVQRLRPGSLRGESRKEQALMTNTI